MSEIALLNLLRLKVRIILHKLCIRLILFVIYLVYSRGSLGQLDPLVLLEKTDKEYVHLLLHNVLYNVQNSIQLQMAFQ